MKLNTKSETIAPKVTMIQDGARRHYIVPVALQYSGVLYQVFADWYVRKNSFEELVSKLVKLYDSELGQRMLDRHSDQLNDSMIRTHPWMTIRNTFTSRRYKVIEEFYASVSERQERWILSRDLGDSTHVYGYVRNVHPNLFRQLQSRGIKTIGDQIIAPAAIEFQEYEKQQAKWPNWEKYVAQNAYSLVDRFERETWDASDRLLCGSDYVKKCMIECGVGESRIEVIPYAPSGSNYSFVNRRDRKGPIIVGFVGAVNLRKGAPVFFEMARRFDPEKVRFVMVGGIHLNPEVVAKEKGSVDLIGGVPRSEVKGWYEKFDILFFPSTCEGCAGAVLEAMDTGLPVVSTYNSGTVLQSGVSGFLHDYDDVNAMHESLRKLIEDEDLRVTMGHSARERIESFNLKWYADALLRVLA